MHQSHFLTSRLSFRAAHYLKAVAICSALILAVGCKNDDPPLVGPIKPAVYFFREGKILKTDPLTVGWNDPKAQHSALFVLYRGWRSVVFDFQWGAAVQDISSSPTSIFDFSDVDLPVDKTKSTSLVYSGTQLKGHFVYKDEGSQALDLKVADLKSYDNTNVQEIRDFFSANGLASEF